VIAPALFSDEHINRAVERPMMKIFFSPGACSLASHIALVEAGAHYEAHRLDFKAGEQTKPDYLAVNPKGRVPALVTNRGILTETPAILAYIAQSFPAAKLAPLDDPHAFAELQAFNSYLCSTVHVAHAHKMRGARWADDPAALAAMTAKVPESVGKAFQLIETTFLRGPWVMGETYSVADPYLFTVSSWLEGDRVDLSKLPRVLAHRERVRARPAVKRALAEEGVAA
jgi:glutathione S-transferase